MNMTEELESIYLSYSGWKTYDECPQQYKWKYVDKVPVLEDPRRSMFGTTIGKIFEWFYDKEIWKCSDPVSVTLSYIKPALIWTLEHEKFISNGEADKKHLKEIRENLEKYVPLAIENIKKHKLLSYNTRTEFKLDTTYKSNNHDFAIKMGGKADFIHGLKDDLWLIDGKGGEKEYVDPYQLIWYATQHFLKFRVAPVRIGFLFYKYPDDPVQWIDYDNNSIRDCVKNTYRAANSIHLKMFDPKPSKKCKYCPYREGKCEIGQSYYESMNFDEKPRVDIENSILQIDDI